MKAVGYRQSLPIDHPEALLDLEVPDPVPGPRDLLVEVRAVSVNPVDTKVRRRAAPAPGEVQILGWDAAGVVRAVGSEASLFKPGDRVMYAGSLQRPGTNSELHLVDERLVGRMPQGLDFREAAALPLTTITAWELLFDRLQIAPVPAASTGTLLITGAAGGVGSVMTQLARQLTGLTIVGTASRPETRAWAERMGVHHLIDHARPLAPQYAALGLGGAQYVASLTQTDAHLKDLAEILAPQGRLGIIDDPESFDIALLKRKSISLHWEFMFTRSMFDTADMIEQHRLLTRAADMVEAGTLRSTVADDFGIINAANLRHAHQFIESGKARGKVVLAGF